MKLREQLIAMASITADDISAGEADIVFDEILVTLRDIHRGKGVLYGDYIKTHGSAKLTMAAIQHFCDIKRKFVRAENIVNDLSEIRDETRIRALLDTYCDMAVYAIMGIHLVAQKKFGAIETTAGDSVITLEAAHDKLFTENKSLEAENNNLRAALLKIGVDPNDCV